MGLEVFKGDEMSSKEEALLDRLMSEGDEVVDASWEGGWSHHSGAVVAELEGVFYLVSGSGCSCGGSGSVEGPYPSVEAAIAAAGVSDADDLRRAWTRV